MNVTEKEALLRRVDAEIEKYKNEIAAMSDYFAANPELSGEEFETSAKIVETLKKVGFEVEYPYAGLPTAFLAKKGRSKSEGGQARVAIMAEYDALPEIGHACGHNLHGAMSVLAGIALFPIIDELDGELWIVGTPAEETEGAKVKMTNSGVFDGCDFAIMLHCDCGKTTARYRALAIDCVEFVFTGQTSHAASAPWEGRNALNGLQLFFHAIDMYRQHIIPDARMHGIYKEGGAAPNIVPDRAIGHFYFRAPKRAYLDKMMNQIYNCARGAALATGTEVTWRAFESSFKDVLPNDTAEDMIEEILSELDVPVTPCLGFLGSTDVGDVSYACPALQPMLDISEGIVYEAHTREFAAATVAEAGHRALEKGAKIIARSVFRVFTEPELRARMRADFEKEKE